MVVRTCFGRVREGEGVRWSVAIVCWVLRWEMRGSFCGNAKCCIVYGVEKDKVLDVFVVYI